MSTAIVTKRRKRCSHCGELKDEVIGRQRLCEDCEQDMTYCQVCDEFADRSWGGGCRHVQWSDEIGCHCGCGTTELIADEHKESFFVLLDRFKSLTCTEYKRGKPVKSPLLPRLAQLIKADNFWTFWYGPMIGGPPQLELRYVKKFPKHESVLDLRTISASEQEAWGEEAIEQMQLGMAWLTSLNGESTTANKLTAKWIAEFLKPRKGTPRT